jgi:hypothetical protein
MKIVITLLLLVACQCFDISLFRGSSSFLENFIAMEFSSVNTAENMANKGKNLEFKGVKCSMISEDGLNENDNNLRLDEEGIFILAQNGDEVKINYSE